MARGPYDHLWTETPFRVNHEQYLKYYSVQSCKTLLSILCIYGDCELFHMDLIRSLLAVPTDFSLWIKPEMLTVSIISLLHFNNFLLIITFFPATKVVQFTILYAGEQQEN